MNSQSQSILVVEIRTLEPGSIDNQQLMPMIVHQDENDRLYLVKGMKTVRDAIVAFVPHLSENYRHPLLFEVQILPGDRCGAYSDLSSQTTSKFTRRKKRSDSNN